MTRQTKMMLTVAAGIVLVAALAFIYWKTKLPDNCYREQVGKANETICD